MNWLLGTPMTVKPRSLYCSWMRSSPSYWGVRPHFEATLTKRIASSLWSRREASWPCRVLTGTSMMDMPATLAGDHPNGPRRLGQHLGVAFGQHELDAAVGGLDVDDPGRPVERQPDRPAVGDGVDRPCAQGAALHRAVVGPQVDVAAHSDQRRRGA